MSKINQKVELAANVLIVIVSILLIGVIAQRFFFNVTTSNRPEQLQPTIGMKVNLPNGDLTEKSKTVILVLQKGCRFCTESAPFYKRLQENVFAKNYKLLAVLPGKVEESTAYIRDLGLYDIEVKQASFANFQTNSTPTLILTNNKGEVTHYWIGRLSPDKEAEVISQLSS